MISQQVISDLKQAGWDIPLYIEKDPQPSNNGLAQAKNVSNAYMRLFVMSIASTALNWFSRLALMGSVFVSYYGYKAFTTARQINTLRKKFLEAEEAQFYLAHVGKAMWNDRIRLQNATSRESLDLINKVYATWTAFGALLLEMKDALSPSSLQPLENVSAEFVTDLDSLRTQYRDKKITKATFIKCAKEKAQVCFEKCVPMTIENGLFLQLFYESSMNVCKINNELLRVF